MPTTIEKQVLEVSQLLKQRQLKVVTAESCTGGGLSEALTRLSGSSDWFERGFITYSNQSKMECLGVKHTTLYQFGAVSEQTALEMAEGALMHSQADISIAITGIAGPEGGLPDKPVGTVWIACAMRDDSPQAEVNLFTGNRLNVRKKSIECSLRKVIALLKKSL